MAGVLDAAVQVISQIEGRLSPSASRQQAGRALLSEVESAINSTARSLVCARNGDWLTVQAPVLRGLTFGAKVVLKRAGRPVVYSLTTPEVHVSPDVDFNVASARWEASILEGAPHSDPVVLILIAACRVIEMSMRVPVDPVWSGTQLRSPTTATSMFWKAPRK